MANKKKAAKATDTAPKVRGRPLSSIRAYCEEHGHDRDTVARKLTEAGVGSVGRERGHEVYRERDLHAVACAAHDGAPRDPHRRKAYFEAELNRVKLEEAVGDLIPRTDVERAQAEIFKELARTLDTLPDVLERDCGLPAHALARLEEALDAARNELRRRLLADDEVRGSAEPLDALQSTAARPMAGETPGQHRPSGSK